MSFWEREVRIWQIAKASDAHLNSQKNQLVGRVLIPGEDNITSAAISSDGSLLVVSTMTAIRLFHLHRSEDQGEDNVLEIEDLLVPQQLSDEGARSVSLSPDLQWLSIVRPNNDIYLAKLSPPTSNDGNSHVNPTLLHVERTTGKATSFKAVTNGTFGKYDRTIRTVAFSSDSKIFATGDLAGFVDGWMLEDVPERGLTATKKAPNGTVSSDDESSDDEEEDSIDGQHWKHLPVMPCVNASIAFMSFRPALRNESEKSATTEDRLVVLTNKHQLVEYETLTGKLSEWSQRNPKTHLPEEFTGLKDRVMGGFCDVFHGSSRLFVYGTSWMSMFDLTQDLPAPVSISNGPTSTEVVKATPQKRKRADDESKGFINSGAGDLIPPSQATVSMGAKYRKIDGKNRRTAQWVDVEGPRRQQNNRQNGDEVDEHDSSHPFIPADEPDFAHLRREVPNETTSTLSKQLTNGVHDNDDKPSPSHKGPSVAVVIDNSTTHDTTGDSPAQQKQNDQITAKTQRSAFWHSHKFRDILGIVPLSPGLTGETTDKTTVEIAVVERPMWDLDLGDRYVRDYE